MQLCNFVFMIGMYVVGCGVFFIFLVCCYVQFGVFMYLFGMDLDFNGFIVWFQDYGVDRLVIVWFWVSDIIIEFIWQVVIVCMYYF